MWSTKAISRALQAPILILVTIVSLASVAAAQEEKPTGNSTITGRVVFADTGRPVRRASVKLYTDMTRGPARATAASVGGEFRFTEVAAGSYFVVAEVPGVLFPRSAYAINEFGMGSDVEMDQTRVTVDGKNSVRCDVRVMRAGTISGTITYADKEPVVNGRIVLFRRKGSVLAPYFSEIDATNDRGMYRIDGLPAGEYFVGVITGKIAATTVTRVDATGIPTAYYPGVVSVLEAKPIQIQSASEVTGVNITLNDERLRRISGVVKWRQSGSVATGAVLSLRRKDDPKVNLSLTTLFQAMTRGPKDEYGLIMKNMSMLSRSFPPLMDADAKGEWAFDDLPPGTYLITAFASPPKKNSNVVSSNEELEEIPSAFDEKQLVFCQVEVTIAEVDRTNVTIELPQGGRIIGTVVIEESPSRRISIMVDQPGGNEMLMTFPRYSNPDGSFVLERVPSGEVILDADVLGFDDLYLKSITLNGQDLLRDPVRVNEGAEVAGVRITIGKGLATVSGGMQLKEDGSPVAGGGVLLIKADPKLWHLRSSRCLAMTNPAGEFMMKCPPGEYLLFNWAAGRQPMQSIQEFVRSNASSARTVSLQSKEEKRLDLIVAGPPR